MPGAPADLATRAGDPSRSAARWWLSLLAVVAVGVAVRALHVLVVMRDVPPGLDAVWYSLQGGSLRGGTGYVAPPSLFTGELVPTAAFPPGYPAAQAVWQAAWGDGQEAIRLLGTVLGAATIALTGLLGRRVVGPAAGLVAAALVAVDPALVAVDGSGMSESLTVPLLTAIVLLACRALDRGFGLLDAAVLGVVCAAAALTRQDLLLVAPVLLVGVAVLAPERRDDARSEGARRRAGARIAAAAVGIVVLLAGITPWALRNERAVGVLTISTLSPTSALAGSNCELTYGGDSLGSWEFPCVVAAQRLDLPESEQAELLQDAGLGYARDHVGRLPLVLPARVLRVWGLWDPRDQVPREVEESRSEPWQQIAWVTNLALLAAGAWGLAVTCRHRLRRTFPLLVPPAMAVATALVSYGNPRFSAIAHPVLAVGAAALVSRWWVRRRAVGRAVG